MVNIQGQLKIINGRGKLFKTLCGLKKIKQNFGIFWSGMSGICYSAKDLL